MLRTVMATAKRRSPPRRSARLLAPLLPSFARICDSLLTAKQDGVPTARRQLNRFALQVSPRVAPAQLYADRLVSCELAQPKLQIRTALAGMSVTAVNLLHERCASS